MRQNRPPAASGTIIVTPPGEPVGGDPPTGPAASGTIVPFNPTILPLSGPELINPNRGAYSWMGQQQAPVGGTKYFYDRDIYNWHDLEPTSGNYTPFINLIEQKAAAAKAAGGKYGFRVATAFSGLRVPDYVASAAGVDWCAGFAVPNWNSSAYVGAVVNLYTALGAHFGSDPRIGIMDISCFGNYGEFHTWDITCGPYQSATTANLTTMIDAQVAAFPDAQWEICWGGQDYVKDAVRHFMGLTYGPNNRRGGWRNDCLGSDPFQPNMTSWQVYGEYADRWKFAPTVGELCNIAPDGFSWTSGSFARVLQQVKDNHVHTFGNGNTSEGTYPNFSATEQQNWLTAAKTSGYRIELSQVTIPNRIEQGSHITIRALWRNSGVAPLTENFRVRYRLKNSSGNTVWSGISTAVIKGLLPAGAASPFSDNFNMPADLPIGTMTLTVELYDVTGYFTPISLAISGRATDGSYSLGNVITAAPV